jgi:hypothetical protein
MSWTGAPGGSRRRVTLGCRRRGAPHSRLSIAVVVLMIFGGLPASAALRSLAEIDCEPSPTELEDIAVIAEQDGLTQDEAMARYGWQGCFGEVTSYLSGVYSDQYAGAAIVQDGRGAWIAFKADIPEEAHGLVEAIPVPVELVGSRGFSEAELNETLVSVYPDISNHEDVVAASGSYDIETGVITIHAQPLASLTDSDQRERLRETLQPDQPVNTAISIEVVVVDELGGRDDESSGQTDGSSPAVYAGVLAASVLVLLAGWLMRDRGRSSRT